MKTNAYSLEKQSVINQPNNKRKKGENEEI